MKRWRSLAVLVVCAGLLLSGCAHGGGAGRASKLPAFGVANVVSLTAIVKAVDPVTRTLTLQGPDGNVATFTLGDQVRNLSRVKPGDEVNAEYYEEVSVQVLPLQKGEEPGVSVEEVAGRAEPGQMPAGGAFSQITVSATITDIDKMNCMVTLKGPRGNLRNVRVYDPKNLEHVKVGDLVAVTYTQAVAIDVTHPDDT